MISLNLRTYLAGVLRNNVTKQYKNVIVYAPYYVNKLNLIHLASSSQAHKGTKETTNSH